MNISDSVGEFSFSFLRYQSTGASRIFVVLGLLKLKMSDFCTGSSVSTHLVTVKMWEQEKIAKTFL